MNDDTTIEHVRTLSVPQAGKQYFALSRGAELCGRPVAKSRRFALAGSSGCRWPSWIGCRRRGQGGMRAGEIAGALGDARRVGRGWRCRCPLHGGRSLVLCDGDRGRLFLTCWGGCDRRGVLASCAGAGCCTSTCLYASGSGFLRHAAGVEEVRQPHRACAALCGVPPDSAGLPGACAPLRRPWDFSAAASVTALGPSVLAQ